MGVEAAGPATKTSWPRRIVIVVASIVSVPASAVAVFAAFIGYSGCFIVCPDGGPQHNTRYAVGFGALSVVLFFLGPLLAWRLTHSQRWILTSFLLPLALVVAVLVLGVVND